MSQQPTPIRRRPTPPTPTPAMHAMLVEMRPVLIAEMFPEYTQYFLVDEVEPEQPLDLAS